MTVEAVWDQRLRRFKYRLPGRGAGFVTTDRAQASPMSSNAVLAREVKALAFATGVRLPARWDLLVTR